jgi:ribonuclease HI
MMWGWKCKKASLREIVGRISARTSLGGHSVKYVKVKGHDGNPNNERADALATEGRRRLLQDGAPA